MSGYGQQGYGPGAGSGAAAAAAAAAGAGAGSGAGSGPGYTGPGYNGLAQGAGAGSGSGYDDDDDDGLHGAAELASHHAGNSGDVSLFSSILDSIRQKKNEKKIDKDDVDESTAIKNHKKYFDDNEDDDGEDVNERSMGTAAAIQALKMFTGHGASGTSADGVAATGQSGFVGLAMSQASMLFDKQSAQGKVTSGSSKESAVMQAGEMALKLYMKGKADAPAAGPGGGVGGLLSMASKFMS